MLNRARPFVLPVKQPADAHPATPGRVIGPTDIVIVSGDSVRVCRVEMTIGSPGDGPTPLTLCRVGAGESAGLVEGWGVTQVGGVRLLQVE